MDKHVKICTKISGYLEKKGKKKMISSYKKYWFVLEGGLLLYYRSKDDYETLSPCKGSINLGPPCIVKPCPSLPGVFQIQTRIATVTITVEDNLQEDALYQVNHFIDGLVVIMKTDPDTAQSKCLSFMNACSSTISGITDRNFESALLGCTLDDQKKRAENRDEQNKWMQAIISEINPQKNIQRMSHFRYSMENVSQARDHHRNSTPESESSHNSNEDIIHRLQKMGAQSYNPIGTINKIATLRQKDRTPLPEINFDNDVRLDNRDSKSSEHIYERISAEIKESLLNEEKETNEFEKRSMTLPTQGFNTLRIKKEENKPKTFIIENDTYAISIQQKQKSEDTKVKSKSDKKSNTKEEKSKDKKKVKHSKSFFSKRGSKDLSSNAQNEEYAEIKKYKSANDENDKEYTDHNENNLLKNESRKIEEENAYSIPNFFDVAGKQEEYNEDEHTNVEYSEPGLFQVEVDKTKETIEEKDKKKSKIKKKKSEEKGDTKLRKRPSFIKRVWKRKEKNHKDKETAEEKLNDEELYETVPAAVVEDVCVTDFTAVEMISELQNILEHKVPILMEKMANDMNSLTVSDLHEPDPETVAKKEENIIVDVSPKIPDSLLVPTKTQLETSFPSHDVPISKPVALPPKKNRKLETIRSLDEILHELDTQTDKQKNKVKKLIKRFSEPEFSERDVILRNGRQNGNRDEIDSDELSRLLEELAKVTNAPILTPGVTSSLNGSNMPDEEFSKLLPTKQRRFSEPDYDIPRPHKSLTMALKRDIVSENVIGSTRFFGPILKPSDMMVPSEKNPSESPSQLNSITPDSLETNEHHLPPARPLQEIDENPYSHKYYKFVDRRMFYNRNNLSYPPIHPKPIFEKKHEDDDEISGNQIEDFIVENEIYAEPRSISMNFELSKDKIINYEQDDEVFIDSLEVCKNEVSTEF